MPTLNLNTSINYEIKSAEEPLTHSHRKSLIRVKRTGAINIISLTNLKARTGNILEERQINITC